MSLYVSTKMLKPEWLIALEMHQITLKTPPILRIIQCILRAINHSGLHFICQILPQMFISLPNICATYSPCYYSTTSLV